MMKEAGHWLRARGFANAGAAEALFICWKGQVPKTPGGTRSFVDVGSEVFVDFISNVPIVLPDDAVRVEQSQKLAVLRGTPDITLAINEEGGSDAEQNDKIVTPSKKGSKRKHGQRRFVLRAKEISSSDVILFRHETHPLLIKELVESLKADWAVLYTPAAGLSANAICELGKFAVFVGRNPDHGSLLETEIQFALGDALLKFGDILTVTNLAEQGAALAEPHTAKKQRKDNAESLDSSSAPDTGAEASETESPSESPTGGKKHHTHGKHKDRT